MALNLDEGTISATEYYKAIDEFKSLNKNMPQKDLMSTQWVDIMIQRIQAAEMIAIGEGFGSLHESVKQTLRTYQVDSSTGEKKLAIKPILSAIEQKPKIIIPLEGTYEIIQKAHLNTNHGTPNEMEAWLVLNNYIMARRCADIYYELCGKCTFSQDTQPIPTMQDIAESESTCQTITDREIAVNAYKSNINQDVADPKIMEQEMANSEDIFEAECFEHVNFVDILDISENPDHYFNYLLIHENKTTNFVQLRPLNSNSEAEIAVELIKIFMDFGPPECIVVDPVNKCMFHRILYRVKVLSGTETALAVHKTENKFVKIVAKNIINWMQEQDCKNWGTGCHIVQWNMNNNLDETATTPFSRTFGYKYTGYGNKSKFISRDIPVIDNSDEDGNLNLDEEEDDDAETTLPTSEDQPLTNEPTNENGSYIVSMEEEEVKSKKDGPILEKILEKNPTLKLHSIQYDSDEEIEK